MKIKTFSLGMFVGVLLTSSLVKGKTIALEDKQSGMLHFGNILCSIFFAI